MPNTGTSGGNGGGSSYIPVTPPAEPHPTSGYCGSNLSWVIDDTGVLRISGSGKMESYSSGWWDKEQVVAIVIEEGLTEIGASAFAGCTQLKEVYLPQTLKVINTAAFSGASVLTYIELPSGLTDIGVGAFSGCTSLTEITIPSSVTSIRSLAFSDWTSNQTINVEKWLKAPDTWMSFPGSGCAARVVWGYNHNPADTVYSGYCGNNLLWKMNGNGVVTISGTGKMDENKSTAYKNYFWDKELVTMVYVENGVGSIGDKAFSNCPNLECVVINDGVTEIGASAFSGCPQLKEVYLPQTLKVINTAAFSGASELMYIELPSGLTEIGVSAFSGCTSLMEITIPSSVTSIRSIAFNSWTSGQTINVEKHKKAPSGWMSFPGSGCAARVVWGYGLEDEDILASGYCGSNLNWKMNGAGVVTISGTGKMNENKTTKYKTYFWDKESVTEVIIEDGVGSIGKNAFSACRNLKKVTVGNGVTEIGESAFYGCENLTTVVLPKGLKIISTGAFGGCTVLKDINIPSTVTTISNMAFYNCTSIREIVLPAGITTMSGTMAFTGWTANQTIYVETLKSVPYGLRNSFPGSRCNARIVWGVTVADVPKIEEPDQGKTYNPGDVMGYVYYTDIVAYIDGRPIQSFNINGNTYIVVEHLSEYGFDVEWNGVTGVLTLGDRKVNRITSTYRPDKNAPRKTGPAFPYLYTDIKTNILTGNTLALDISAYNISGLTCICMDDLAKFYAEEYVWDPVNLELRLTLKK